MEINCREVLHEMSNYIDHEVDPRQREAISAHLTTCDHCTAVFDGARNVIRLVCDERIFTLPAGFSQRLYGRLATQSMEN